MTSSSGTQICSMLHELSLSLPPWRWPGSPSAASALCAFSRYGGHSQEEYSEKKTFRENDMKLDTGNQIISNACL